jgi:hypothetical protein
MPNAADARLILNGKTEELGLGSILAELGLSVPRGPSSTGV